MSIDRVHYEERQYLRSFDFIAEQTYHLEMRRRLNLALHLWGIVDGLELAKGPLDPALPDQCFIRAGMAIDGFGREILLVRPYTLSQLDIVSNRIKDAGEYAVWIAYQRALETPPSAGYRLCDVKDQYTRWRESSRIIVTNAPPPTLPAQVTDDLSDDPGKKPWFVRLGTATVTMVTGELTFTDARSDNRVYIGLRAQRVVAPVASLPATTADSSLPISVEADLQERKNLLVMKDVADVFVDPAKVKPPPGVSPFPTAEGNVLVAGDVFLRGNLYKFLKGSDPSKDQWLALKEYFKQLLPDIQVGTTEVVPVITVPGNTVTGTQAVQLTTALVTSGPPKVTFGIGGVKSPNTNNFFTWLTNVIDLNQEAKLTITLGTMTAVPGPTNTWNVPFNWEVGPTASGTTPLPLTSFVLNYTAIFFP
jgi:hypothetical protein